MNFSILGLVLLFALSKNEMEITIRQGETLSEIATELHSEGVISSVFWFKTWTQFTRNDRNIKAGYYIFKKPTAIREVLRVLVAGKTSDVKVTIPEGATLKDIAWLFWKRGDIDKEKFLQLAQDTSYIKSLGIYSSSLEGFLFPETYFIPFEEDPGKIVSRMVSCLFDVFTEEFRKRAKENGFTLEEAVIMASMIEKEAMVDSEKPIISGVYHNRLKSNRALQSCATIQYILPKRKPKLTNADLNMESPYNTYLHTGLPPGAICSPGASSIRAALWPAETKYYYFVARGDGTHIFSKTAKEHAIAKKRVREMQSRVESKS